MYLMYYISNFRYGDMRVAIPEYSLMGLTTLATNAEEKVCAQITQPCLGEPAFVAISFERCEEGRPSNTEHTVGKPKQLLEPHLYVVPNLHLSLHAAFLILYLCGSLITDPKTHFG